MRPASEKQLWGEAGSFKTEDKNGKISCLTHSGPSTLHNTMKRFMESRELDSICHITRRRHLKNKCLLWIWCQSGTAWAGTLMVQLFEGPAKVDWYIYASQQVLINMLLFQLFCFFRVCNWNQFQKDVTFSENKCYVFSNTQRLFKWSANHCAVFFLIFYTAAQFLGGGGNWVLFHMSYQLSSTTTEDQHATTQQVCH